MGEGRGSRGEVELSGDVAALRGVVINLAQNAAQASEPGQVVVLSVGQSDEGRRLITVRDAGEGMSPELLEQVTRPFFTTREKGTGLGVPLARKVVERHGGRMWIESAPGEGTTVNLDLPYRADAPLASPSDAHIGLDVGDWDGEMIG